MGFRFVGRKAFRVGKYARINVTKTGVGASVGNRALRYSRHSSGRRTISAGAPGSSGLRWRSDKGGSGRPRNNRSSAAASVAKAAGVARTIDWLSRRRGPVGSATRAVLRATSGVVEYLLAAAMGLAAILAVLFALVFLLAGQTVAGVACLLAAALLAAPWCWLKLRERTRARRVARQRELRRAERRANLDAKRAKVAGLGGKLRAGNRGPSTERDLTA